MNPYRSPAATQFDEHPGALWGVLSVFCFGWAFGTATRGELDLFGWLGFAVLVLGVMLWRSSSARKLS